jgi:hypothetical protein
MTIPPLEINVPQHILDELDLRDYGVGPLAAERDWELSMIELMEEN